METDFLTIGGGLSGLLTTWQLQTAGLDVVLLEGRARCGGRALTVGHEMSAPCDLGPSWFWEGQPLIHTLLNHFDIPYFEQFAAGDVLEQRADGRVDRTPGPSPMIGARRIEGGIGRLVDAIAGQIEPARGLLGYRVTALSLQEDRVEVTGAGPDGPSHNAAGQVALAIPPRLIADLIFDPPLPTVALAKLKATPTWMAGHAKFFAVYNEPFWRRDGLCGSAFSRSGPLAEIHDASPEDGRRGVLFGFFGLDGPARARIGRKKLTGGSIEQLTTLFGQKAAQPAATHVQDWTTEPLTAAEGDLVPQPREFAYGLTVDLEGWSGRLDLIASETAPTSGGLVEGALEGAVGYADRFASRPFRMLDDRQINHTASMGWEWL